MSDPAVVRALADDLIARHLSPEWSFAFDHAMRRAGQCDYTRKRITVSRYLSARYDDETNRQTLLHEVAHALCEPSVGHGAAWKKTARMLGYTGGTTHSASFPRSSPRGWASAPTVTSCSVSESLPERCRARAVTPGRFDRRFTIRWHRREVSAADRLAARTPR